MSARRVGHRWPRGASRWPTWAHAEGALYLRTVEAWTRDRGYRPSQRELAELLGWSTWRVARVVALLRRARLLLIVPRATRTQRASAAGARWIGWGRRPRKGGRR